MFDEFLTYGLGLFLVLKLVLQEFDKKNIRVLLTRLLSRVKSTLIKQERFVTLDFYAFC